MKPAESSAAGQAVDTGAVYQAELVLEHHE
jgi:hypothetical protein